MSFKLLEINIKKDVYPVKKRGERGGYEGECRLTQLHILHARKNAYILNPLSWHKWVRIRKGGGKEGWREGERGRGIKRE